MSTNKGADETDVGSIWASTRGSLVGLMSCTLLAGVVTFSVLSFSAKPFQAEALLTVAAGARQPGEATKGESGPAPSRVRRVAQAALDRHVRGLQASDLLIGVGKKLKLTERSEFNAASGPLAVIDQLLRRLGQADAPDQDTAERRMLAAMRNKLAVSPHSAGEVISIRFSSHDPQLAMDVANGIATAYRDRLRSPAGRDRHDLSGGVPPTLERWRREIDGVDAAAKRFEAEANGSVAATATPAHDAQAAARHSARAVMQRTLENAAQTMRVELQRLQRALADKPNARNADQTAAPTPSVKVAKEPEQMVSAEKVPYTLLAMAATLMLGLALTITRGLLATSGSVAWHRAMNNSTAGSGAVISRKGGAPGTDDDSEDAPLPVVGAASMRPPSVANLEMFAAQRSFLSMTEYAQHLIGELPVEGGYRLLMTGSHEAVDPSDEVIDLVGELSDAGLSVLLVDWSLDGERLHSDIEIGPAASLAEVMSGDAEFDDILVTLPDSNLHYVYSTDARAGGGLLNEDHLNLVLDALDEAYDYVIVAGAYDDARALFEAIQGRFDAGMTVADANVAAPAVSDDSFLGFEVADIEVVQFVRTSDRLDENRPAVEASGGNIGSRF